MADQARVTSLEVLEAFRAKLIVYREKASRVMDEVSDDVTKTRLWLQSDRPQFWAVENRRRARNLEQAQQELFSAQLSGLRDASIVQQDAVRKARNAVREGEDRARSVKIWSRQFDHRVEPLARNVEKLRQVLDKDLPAAIARLAEIEKTLAAYAELSPATTTPESTKP
jgi:hypothetical protein